MRVMRQLSLALLVSVALNFMLGGLAITQWITAPSKAETWKSHRFDREAARLALPEAHRAVVDAVWERHRDAAKDGIRALREQRRDVRRLLLAPHFDKAAFDAANTELQERSRETRGRLRGLFGEIAAALPDEERIRYFEAGYPKRTLERLKRDD